jgi:chromosome partitioning protein
MSLVVTARKQPNCSARLRSLLYDYQILNACDARIPEVMEARTVLARHGLQVAPIDIGQRVPFARAVASGLSVTEFDAKGKAALEIGELWRWIKKQLGSP